jgi:SH3 domain-containing YSC84-like protein 1
LISTTDFSTHSRSRDFKKSGKLASSQAGQLAGPSSINLSSEPESKEQHFMKRTFVFLLVAMSGMLAWAGEQKKDVTERLQMGTDVLSQMTTTPDKGIPEEVLDNAKCIAVVPHLVKGGFILGGKHGRGMATCRTADGWSAPAFISVGGGSAGFQIGLEGVDLIMLIMNDKGMQQLLTSKFEVSGEGSAAAGPVGRHASAGTDWKMDTQMLTYSRSKGVFAGLTLEGAVVQQDNDSTNSVYGHEVAFKSVLLGKVSTPDIAKAFMKAVAEAAHKAKVQEARDEKK